MPKRKDNESSRESEKKKPKINTSSGSQTGQYINEITEDSFQIQVENNTSPKLQLNQDNNSKEKNKQETEKKDERIEQPKEDDEVTNKLRRRNDELEKKINELEQTNNELRKILEEKDKLFKENGIPESPEVQHKENNEKNAENLEQHTTDQDKYKNMVDSLQQQLEEKEDDLRKLEEKNAELRKEASKYQSALGNATNIRLGDEDSVKFREDILTLQKTLENYVTNLKPNMDVDVEKVQILAEKYGCLTPVNQKNKPFIKALLQRKVLDDILNSSKNPGDKGDVELEVGIENKAQELLSLIETFSASRSGTDEIVKVAAIKVRQQVYGILGNRGFADVIGPNESHVHDFITSVSDNLNNTMNQYRKIKDPNKKKEVESIAPKLIQDIYKLFFYLLNVQEPRVQYKFCENGVRIDPTIMKGRWDEDEIPQLCVDICCFPIIGRDLDSPNWKIYTQAKVFPRSLSE